MATSNGSSQTRIAETISLERGSTIYSLPLPSIPSRLSVVALYCENHLHRKAKKSTRFCERIWFDYCKSRQPHKHRPCQPTQLEIINIHAHVYSHLCPLFLSRLVWLAGKIISTLYELPMCFGIRNIFCHSIEQQNTKLH